MYTPEPFKETDTERILALIETHPFGILITVGVCHTRAGGCPVP